MTVYCPECWICKHAITANGLKEGDVIFVGCEQTYRKEPCKFEGAEFSTTTCEKLVRVSDIKIILRSGVCLDTEADQDYVCKLIDELDSATRGSK